MEYTIILYLFVNIFSIRTSPLRFLTSSPSRPIPLYSDLPASNLQQNIGDLISFWQAFAAMDDSTDLRKVDARTFLRIITL